MLRRVVLLAMSVLAFACWHATPLAAQQQVEPRIAFVVGNSAYARGEAPTALNDAGLVAEALRSIGFEIVEGANLAQPDLVRIYREFLAKIEASGPDTLAFVYFSGDAASFEGENFLLGVDAQLERDSDIPIEGVRLGDLLRPLAGSAARAKVMMIDAARPIPFQPQGRPLARGLEALDPPPGMLIAYSSAPGTQAPDRPGDYGAYAMAIAEMLRAPGIDLNAAFTYIRSRTHETTEGQQTPWHVSALNEPIDLVPAQAAAAMAIAPPPPIRQPRPMRGIGPEEAYALAIEMDTLEGYVEFVEAYPSHPLTRRVWAMIRARREALAWMRALEINTPRSYWTYLRRYPNGMYAYDAERRLRRLGSPFAPPQGFVMMEFDDVPMALMGEPVQYEEVYRVGPPPPHGFYGAPRPAYLTNIAPARRSSGAAAVLPALAVAIPVVTMLAPAPRRSFAPDQTRTNAFGARQNFGNRPVPAATPANVAPSAVAPSAAAPSATVAPASPGSAAPGQGRPPGWTPGQGQGQGRWQGQPGQGRTPPGVATQTPSGANAPAAVPSTAAPSVAVAPTAPAASPSALGRPPGWTPGQGPGQGRGPDQPRQGHTPPSVATQTPSGSTAPAAAPSTAAPSTASAPATSAAPSQQPPRGYGRPPGSGPPPGTASRAPPGPPPQVNRPPPPPPQNAVARPAPPAQPVTRSPPPPKPSAPPPQTIAKPAPPQAPPPPKPAAPASATAKPPTCPAGQSLQNGVCK